MYELRIEDEYSFLNYVRIEQVLFDDLLTSIKFVKESEGQTQTVGSEIVSLIGN